MSKLSDKVKKSLKECLPSYTLIEEYYIKLDNTKLLFDFYIPELRLVVEVQGQQHMKFNSFFYKDIDEFNRAKARDNLKQEWAEENEIKLIYFYSKEIENLTPDLVIDRILGK